MPGYKRRDPRITVELPEELVEQFQSVDELSAFLSLAARKRIEEIIARSATELAREVGAEECPRRCVEAVVNKAGLAAATAFAPPSVLMPLWRGLANLKHEYKSSNRVRVDVYLGREVATAVRVLTLFLGYPAGLLLYYWARKELRAKKISPQEETTG